MFTDLLAAVAKSLKNNVSHLSLGTGISQSSVVKILQKHEWHRYTIQMYQYRNEDN